MTKFTPNKSLLSTRTFQRRPAKGFTLVEMLVVMGIIIILIGLLLPAINRAHARAVRARMTADLLTISAALDAYKADMRDYPTVDYTDTVLTGTNGAQNPGATILCWALVGTGTAAQDGADGMGFRLPQSFNSHTGTSLGQTYGPYINPGQLQIGHDAGPTVPNPNIGGGTGTLNSSNSTEPDAWIADRYGHPILYFRANQAAIASGTTYFNTTGSPMYNYTDNQGAFINSAATFTGIPNPSITSPAPQNVAYALAAAQAVMGWQMNGASWTLVQPATTLPYILWSPGPDEQYGVSTSVGQGGMATYDPTTFNTATAKVFAPVCDDVTNFKQ